MTWQDRASERFNNPALRAAWMIGILAALAFLAAIIGLGCAHTSYSTPSGYRAGSTTILSNQSVEIGLDVTSDTLRATYGRNAVISEAAIKAIIQGAVEAAATGATP